MLSHPLTRAMPFVALLLTSVSAQASNGCYVFSSPSNTAVPVSLAGVSFVGDAYPDQVVRHTLETWDVDGASSVHMAITDSKLTSYLDLDSLDDEVTVRFTDNLPINQAGPDLVVFELWTPEPVRVCVGNKCTVAMPAYSGYRLTFTNGTTARINVASVEFSDLGVKVGEAVPELSISGAGRVDVRTNNLVDTPEIGAVAALNSVSGSWSLGKCNNGFGNGDQAAPGGSQTKNGAENNTSGNAK